MSQQNNSFWVPKLLLASILSLTRLTNNITSIGQGDGTAREDYTLLEAPDVKNNRVDVGVTIDKDDKFRPRYDSYDIGVYEFGVIVPIYRPFVGKN